MELLLEQTLNSLQFGLMIFLIASGLTLILGIMNTLNMTHGSFYTLGGYIGASLLIGTGSLLLAVLGAVAAILVLAACLEVLVVRYFYGRDHLEQLLGTFGLLLMLNAGAQIVWGRASQLSNLPSAFSGTVEIMSGLNYPIYRLVISAVGAILSIVFYLVVQKTRWGMLVRAAASNRTMLSALGINVGLVYIFVFCAGAAMAALAGVMIAPLISVDTSMSNTAIVLCFVVITIGGLGSVRGAFVASLLVGFVDTFGRALLPLVFGYTLGPELAVISIYLFMSLFLLLRPEGIFQS
jgi:branched-chain amino acid transport system permease protein